MNGYGKEQDTGGGLRPGGISVEPFRAPRGQGRFRQDLRLPEQFIPGYAHGNKYARKKRKRKKTYSNPMQRQAHDILVENHRDKRHKFESEHELDLQKEKVSDFLANLYTGTRPDPYGKPDIVVEDAPMEEKTMTEEDVEPDLTPEKEDEIKMDTPAPVTPISTSVPQVYDSTGIPDRTTRISPDVKDIVRSQLRFDDDDQVAFLTPEKERPATIQPSPDTEYVDMKPDIASEEESRAETGIPAPETGSSCADKCR